MSKQALFVVTVVTAWTNTPLFPFFAAAQAPNNPPCYVCAGNPDATLDNPTMEVDVSEFNLPIPITRVTCQQIFDAGLQGLIPPTECLIAEGSTDLQQQCGCNFGEEVTTLAPTTVPPTTVQPTTVQPTIVASLTEPPTLQMISTESTMTLPPTLDGSNTTTEQPTSSVVVVTTQEPTSRVTLDTTVFGSSGGGVAAKAKANKNKVKLSKSGSNNNTSNKGKTSKAAAAEKTPKKSKSSQRNIRATNSNGRHLRTTRS
jgi:hypothetical protein